MAAARYDFTIDQGSDFAQTFIWQTADGTPIDNSGWSARMKVKEGATREAAAAVIDSWVELTTGNSRIELGGDTGEITLELVASVTAALALPESRLFYDLELLMDGGRITRFLQGEIVFSPEVTS